jgi:hypothetical protein
MVASSDEIVGGVHVHHRRRDPVELPRGVVVARRAEHVKDVVGVEDRRRLPCRRLQILVGGLARRGDELQRKGSAERQDRNIRPDL